MALIKLYILILFFCDFAINYSISEFSPTFVPFEWNKKLYHVSNQTANWFGAIENCHQNEMELVSIETSEEFNFILHKIQEFVGVNPIKIPVEFRTFWTSGHNLATNSHFTWLTTAKPIDNKFWQIGEPNNYGGNEHCVNIWYETSRTSYSLNDAHCSFKCMFICQTNVKV